jgi:small subunit ribosomal protein S3
VGQKVHPIGFRLGITSDWQSKWYTDKKNYSKTLHEDIKIRNFIKEKYKPAGISKVLIERLGDKLRIKILAAGLYFSLIKFLIFISSCKVLE